MQENTIENQPVDLKQGNGALWTIAGTAIAIAARQLLGGPGGLAGLFGGPPPGGPGAPVTREVLDLTTENQGLKSQLYANTLNAQQAVWNATQQGRIDCLQRQVDELRSLTRVVVPNENLNPGVGPVAVVPVPPVVPPAADVAAIAQAAAQAAVAAAQAAAAKPAGSNGSNG